MSSLKKAFQNKKLGITDLETKIKTLEDKLEQKEKPSAKTPRSTLPKQLLMMHYLGFLNQQDLSDRKKGQLFAQLLNGDENNIRTAMPNFIGNQLRSLGNLKHLEELAELFRITGLNEISQTVEKDIIRLKTGKL